MESLQLRIWKEKKLFERTYLRLFKTYERELPIWGDHSRGTHSFSYERAVYRRDKIFPRYFKIKIEQLAIEQPEGFVLIKVGIDKIFRNNKNLDESELLFALNLLNESTGFVDVYPLDAEDADYLGAIELNWEIIPPGEQNMIVNKILRGRRGVNEELRSKVENRYRILCEMKPNFFIKGTKGFSGYFGAQFGDDLVVFENVSYGNAIYVMFGDWKRLSQLSKTDLFRSENENYLRITHNKGWEVKLKDAVKKLQGNVIENSRNLSFS